MILFQPFGLKKFYLLQNQKKDWAEQKSYD